MNERMNEACVRVTVKLFGRNILKNKRIKEKYKFIG